MIYTTKYSSLFTKELLEAEYLNLQSLKAVGEKYGTSGETIKNYMNKYNIEYKKQVKYNCNQNFFSRDSQKAFYIAGFIAADGCVKKHGSSFQIDIGLAQKDKGFLEMLRSAMEVEAPIHDFTIKNSTRNPNYKDSFGSQLTITSEKMYNDLARFNIVPKKSLIYTFPEWLIEHSMVHHFMRGYNDGDGSFYIPKLKGNRTVPQVNFSLRGTESFLTTYRNILNEYCPLTAKRERKIRIRQSGGIGILEFGGNGVVGEITDFLYKNATICLERKKEIAMKAQEFANFAAAM